MLLTSSTFFHFYIGSFSPLHWICYIFHWWCFLCRAGPGHSLNVPSSPLPVANPNLNSNINTPTNPNLAGRLSYAPVSPSLVPAVNFSTLQPIVLTHDYSLQSPALLNNNHINHNSKHNGSSSNHHINNNNNNNNENVLPSLSSLDWPTTQKAKRVQSRHH